MCCKENLNWNVILDLLDINAFATGIWSGDNTHPF